MAIKGIETMSIHLGYDLTNLETESRFFIRYEYYQL